MNLQTFVSCDSFQTKYDFEDMLYRVAYPIVQSNKFYPLMKLSQGLYYWSKLPEDLECFDYIMNNIIKDNEDFTIVDYCTGRAIWPCVMMHYYNIVYDKCIKFVCIDIDDTRKAYMPIIKGNYTMVRDNDTKQSLLMLHWPPLGDKCAYDALKVFQGNWLLYAGEDEGGCTADDSFFELLRAEWVLEETFDQLTSGETFTGSKISSRIFIYKRKKLKKVLKLKYEMAEVYIIKNGDETKTAYIKLDEKKLPAVLEKKILCEEKHQYCALCDSFHWYKKELFYRRTGTESCLSDAHRGIGYIPKTNISLYGIWFKKNYSDNMDVIKKDIEQILNTMHTIKLNKNSIRLWIKKNRKQ
jgi:hypothetical protein